MMAGPYTQGCMGSLSMLLMSLAMLSQLVLEAPVMVLQLTLQATASRLEAMARPGIRVSCVTCTRYLCSSAHPMCQYGSTSKSIKGPYTQPHRAYQVAQGGSHALPQVLGSVMHSLQLGSVGFYAALHLGLAVADGLHAALYVLEALPLLQELPVHMLHVLCGLGQAGVQHADDAVGEGLEVLVAQEEAGAAHGTLSGSAGTYGPSVCL